MERKDTHTHRKYVLQCCNICTSIVINGQEYNRDDIKMCRKIRFHIYRVFLITMLCVHQMSIQRRTACLLCSTLTETDKNLLLPQLQIFYIMNLINDFFEENKILKESNTQAMDFLNKFSYIVNDLLNLRKI